MRRRDFLKASAPLVVVPALMPYRSLAQTSETPPALPPAGADGWVSLINGRDLSGWYTMLQKSGKGVAEKRNMVTMEEQMLHILGNDESDDPVESGYIATNQEFENVHIRVEYKWGMKRHAPRFTPKRDNGVLYGVVGEDKVWPTCVECQIEEGDVGDFFLVGGVRGIQARHGAGLFGVGINPLTGWPKAESSGGPGRAGGSAAAQAPPEPTGGRFIKDGDFELLDQWNTVEVIWQGDKAEHIVNGRTVNLATNLQQPDPQNPGSYIPLTRGKIAIEIEFAEIWYRRVEVKALV
ncbi:MAG TPA: family 16 glycoside hydrolase [Candidatus Acidoferrales bacterium]|nr:family 16 glycoside hydrolase [Candidatus Acidoferrales bacterium]